MSRDYSVADSVADQLIRKVNQLYSEPIDSDPEVVGTKVGASMGVVAAVEAQKRTRNPFVVAAATLLGTLGAFVGSLADNKRAASPREHFAPHEDPNEWR